MENEIKLELFADYFQFYIQDEKADEDLGDAWNDEAVKRLLAVKNEIIGIGTVRNMTVPVTIKTFENEPNLLSDESHIFEQINECDLEVKSGKIVIAGCSDYFPEATRVELNNGIYRARIYYGNLDKISDDGLDGEDFYEIHLWVTHKFQGVEVIKSRSSNT